MTLRDFAVESKRHSEASFLRSKALEGNLIPHEVRTWEVQDFGSLVRRRGKLGRTFVEEGVKGHGLENAYCE